MIVFNNISSINFLIKDSIFNEFQEYDYRGEKGYAKLIGWELVVFSLDKKHISAIKLCFNSDYDEINSKSENIANLLIDNFQQKLMPKNLNKIFEPIKVEENIMSDVIDYYYHFDDIILIIGILEDKIQTFEYSIDKSINRSVLDFINT
ncbi:hypothetical protein [uncultured Algibacter sp.]|uniref:hypothetical protein n=1 Tax=uncultured Algibacter sp. TaxID=298659 RepID=UPI00321777A1